MMLHNGEMISNLSTYSHKGIFHIVFSHMKRPYNILDMQTLDELDYVLDNCMGDQEYKGIVLLSSKTSFVVGANVKDFVEAHEAPDEHIDSILKKGQRVFNRIEDLDMPSVSIVNGITMGGGLELALACTARVLVKDSMFKDQKYTPIPRSKLSLPEVKLGILPSWGGTTRLPRMISPTKAMSIICSGRNIKQPEALKIGLANSIKPHHKALREAYNIIDNIDFRSIRSQKTSPVIVPEWKIWTSSKLTEWFIRYKQKRMFGNSRKYPSPFKALDTFKRAIRLNRDDSQDLEREAFIELVKTPECQDLVQRFLNGERG